MVYVIWSALLDNVDAGVGVIKDIWEDMKEFSGYKNHVILRDMNRVVVIGIWNSREDADAALRDYRSENVDKIESLVVEPRKRSVYSLIE